MVLEVLAKKTKKKRKERKKKGWGKDIQIVKKEVSSFVGTWLSMYRKLKEVTKKLLKLIRDYHKVTEYKVHIQKFTAFLYTSNEQLGFEIKN